MTNKVEMLLSDAMMLGMCRFKLEPSAWTCGDGGCLLGVAAKAVGVNLDRDRKLPNSLFPSPEEQIMDTWPWLTRLVSVPDFARSLPIDADTLVKVTEDCYRLDTIGYNEIAAEPLISYFAFHVKKGNLTIETVIDWIRSIEPQEKKELVTHETCSSVNQSEVLA